MEQSQFDGNEYYTIDIPHIIKSLWSKLWLILIVGIVSAAVGFLYSSYIIVPQYSSSILLYVNNSSINLGSTSFSISASDISASQSLVETYTELLKNRTTLERIIEKAQVEYTYIELFDMIEAGASNDTQVMKVTVTGTDPYETAEIANTIAVVLPTRVSEIIDGASMEVVDAAIPMLKKISPNITQNTVLAMFLGLFAVSAVIIVLAVMDDTIRSEEYIIETYPYPILAKIPDLPDTAAMNYGYYRSPKPNKNHSEKAEHP